MKRAFLATASPFSIPWMTFRLTGIVTIALLLAVAWTAHAQQRFDGSAIVRAGQMEHVIPIVCDDAARPEIGFATEPSRVTREATGRTSPVNLRLRRWQDSAELVVSLDRYVAWIPVPESRGSVLSLTIAMSPISVLRDGTPVMLTHDMWTSGDRPEGIDVVIEADCRSRDPAAPTSRRVQ